MKKVHVRKARRYRLRESKAGRFWYFKEPEGAVSRAQCGHSGRTCSRNAARDYAVARRYLRETAQRIVGEVKGTDREVDDLEAMILDGYGPKTLMYRKWSDRLNKGE